MGNQCSVLCIPRLDERDTKRIMRTINHQLSNCLFAQDKTDLETEPWSLYIKDLSFSLLDEACYMLQPISLVGYTVSIKTCRRLRVRIKATQHQPDEGGAAIFMAAWLLDASVQHHSENKGNPRYRCQSR